MRATSPSPKLTLPGATALPASAESLAQLQLALSQSALKLVQFQRACQLLLPCLDALFVSN